MGAGGRDGETGGVMTGLPQGSPVSPVIFAICIADIRRKEEG